MPRKPRLSPAAAFCHIMARGIEGRDIFYDDEDRRKFLDLLAKGIKQTGFKCYAWVLMSNHYHLLIRTNEKHLSELMRGLNAGYAQYYSKKYKRRGYLFQDRYKSQVTQDQGYVEKLVQYIHLNPLRAGICKDLAELNDYSWSGHTVILGKTPAPFQDTWPVLRKFGVTVEDGRKGYLKFLSDASVFSVTIDSLVQKKSNDHHSTEYVIGDPEFVKQVFSAQKDAYTKKIRHQLDGLSIEDIAEKISAAAGIGVKELLQRSRGNWRADVRKVFAFICYREYNISIVAIAKFLNIAHSAVSLAIRQAEEVRLRPIAAKLLLALRPRIRRIPPNPNGKAAE
jgi:putative transposase